MKLESANVYLRPYETAYAPVLYQWFYSGEYDEYYRHCAEAYRLDDFQKYIANPAAKIFNIFEKASNLICGMCGIYGLNLTDRSCKLMVMLDKDYQGKKYMAEAIIALGNLAVVDCHIHKIQFEILETNERLKKVILNAGFQKEYTIIDGAWFDGEFKNEDVFCMMEDEWRERYYANH